MASIKQMFPTNFDYELLGKDEENSGGKFSLRVALRNEADTSEWLKEFERLTKTQWIVLRSSGKSCDSPHFVVNRNYACHHSSHRKVTYTAYFPSP